MDKLSHNLAELGTNLAELGTEKMKKRTVKGFPIDADLLMLKVEEEYGFRARDRLYRIIRHMPKYELPSVQPERTCVNCGRTANNGGWYADGGTRCPIEEHYALPKDGYCHLWEKRNVTDDNYQERRKE